MECSPHEEKGIVADELSVRCQRQRFLLVEVFLAGKSSNIMANIGLLA